MEISERLMAIVGEIAFDTIADIGCDHGYISIYACLTGQVKKAVACDIGTGPLERAVHNIEKYGLNHCIETRLGAGLAPLHAGDARTVVIAGLGGRVIIEVLQDAQALSPHIEQLILQPQRDTPAVRRYVHGLGFMITNEKMVYEDGIYYNILNCRLNRSGITEDYTSIEYWLGKILLDRSDRVLWDYMEYQRKKLLNVKSGILPLNEKNRIRLAEIDEELEMLRQ